MFGIGWAPKWHQERTLVLTERAIEILRRQPKRLTAGTVGKKTDVLAPCSLVFPKRARWKGEVRYLRCDCIKTAWLNLLKDAGLSEQGYCWHDMRRSWNRYAAERGIPTAYRAAFLGHRIEVNEGSYETAMGIEFLRSKLGRSLAELPAGVDPVLIQLASSDQTANRK